MTWSFYAGLAVLAAMVGDAADRVWEWIAERRRSR